MSTLTPSTCKLCRFVLETAGDRSFLDSVPFREGVGSDVQPDFLAEDDHWIVALNENQAMLGRVYLVLKRHETDVAALTAPEQSSLWKWIAAVKSALDATFAPDHYNYMFLMNVVGHAHFHIYPRYKTARTFAGVDFTDDQWGDHYDPAAARRLDTSVQNALVTLVKKELRIVNSE